MKTTFLPILSIALAMTFATTTMQAAENKADKAESKTDKKEQGKKLRHVVAFKFKDTATKEQIKQVEDAFRDLKKKIKEIHDFEWGMNNSPEKHNKGTTHGFILTFNSEKDRDVYLDHPAHQEFGKLVGPLLADVFVIDFWAGK
ncbi:MAG: Dabb family protein [Verrucomicrobiales bacterium]